MDSPWLVVSVPENPPFPSATKRPAAAKSKTSPNWSPIYPPRSVYVYAPLRVCAEQVLSARSDSTAENATSNGIISIVLYFRKTCMLNVPFEWALTQVYSALPYRGKDSSRSYLINHNKPVGAL